MLFNKSDDEMMWSVEPQWLDYKKFMNYHPMKDKKEQLTCNIFL